MKLRELIDKLDYEAKIKLYIKDSNMEYGEIIEGYSPTLKFALNDVVLDSEVAEISSLDNKIRIWVEVQDENA